MTVTQLMIAPEITPGIIIGSVTSQKALTSPDPSEIAASSMEGLIWLMIAVLFFIKNFKNSAHGRACLAIRENEIAADTMGIDTTKYKVMAFTLGASFAGTAGVLFSHYFFIAHPASFTFMRSFDILTMVVLGGLGSLTGSITGAILLTFISAALADFPEWRMIIYSLAMIILMLYRPQGLFGNKELSEKVFSSLKGGKNNG